MAALSKAGAMPATHPLPQLPQQLSSMFMCRLHLLSRRERICTSICRLRTRLDQLLHRY